MSRLLLLLAIMAAGASSHRVTPSRDAVRDLSGLTSRNDIDSQLVEQPLQCFEVHHPVLTARGGVVDNQLLVPPSTKTPHKSCSLQLMEHSFANSYGQPFVGGSPPNRRRLHATDARVCTGTLRLWLTMLCSSIPTTCVCL
jgi:hypothetical protein